MQRKHGAAIGVLRATAERCEAFPELRVKMLYVLGSSASIVQPELGVEVYEQLAHDYPQSSFADDALFYEADIQDGKLGKPQDAAATLRRMLAGYPDGDYAVEAEFRLFWIAKAAGHPEAGLDMLAAIEKRLGAEGSVMQSEPLLRARYWRAETIASQPDAALQSSGVAALAALAQAAPFSYYGALALGRLPPGSVAPLPDPPPSAATLALQAGPLPTDSGFRAGVELLRLGFANEAMVELEGVERHGLGGEPLLLLALCLDRAGDHQMAHAIAKSTLRLPAAPASSAPTLSPDDELLWRVAYPLAYRPEIERWAKAARVPPDLMQALMREESALDPAVISGAGAVGLTQLMPATASRVAHKIGLGRVTPASLGDPSLNIRIGTAYVAELLKRFKGNPALALAGYNAGEGAVDRWLGDRGEQELDAFVEQIPIAETRGYVKRVLSTYATYRYLYGKAGDRLSRFEEPLAAAF
jgi:soluble lytic murein transglycosylase